MSDEELKSKEALVTTALRTLSEHFDAVQILATVHEAGETKRLYKGSGNLFARNGMAADFVKLDEASTLADEINSRSEPPEGDEWKESKTK